MEINRQEKGLELGQTVKSWIQDFLKQLEERLNKMEEVLVVDRIEGKVAVCENRENKKMCNIAISSLPKDIKEGSVLKYKDGKYEIDDSNEIEKRIEQKMKDIWN